MGSLESKYFSVDVAVTAVRNHGRSSLDFASDAFRTPPNFMFRRGKKPHGGELLLLRGGHFAPVGRSVPGSCYPVIYGKFLDTDGPAKSESPVVSMVVNIPLFIGFQRFNHPKLVISGISEPSTDSVREPPK